MLKRGWAHCARVEKYQLGHSCQCIDLILVATSWTKYKLQIEIVGLNGSLNGKTKEKIFTYYTFEKKTNNGRNQCILN